jgi:hypothetical protein
MASPASDAPYRGLVRREFDVWEGQCFQQFEVETLFERGLYSPRMFNFLRRISRYCAFPALPSAP